MAAVDTASAGGNRRAVVRSERFMEWQRDLSSNRPAYGAFRHYHDEKNHTIRTYERKSDDMSGRLRSRGLEGKEGDGHNCHNDNLKVRVRRQQPQKHKDSLDCQRLLKGINTDDQCRMKDAQDASHGGLLKGKGSPQLCQPKHALQQTVMRRRRRHEQIENQSQSLRSPGSETNGARNLPTNRGSKRSNRLLARKLGIEKPAPAPLKLPKLQLVVSRKEFLEDWLTMTGQRYVGKPRKSALIQLGLGLCTSLMCPSTIRYLNEM